MKTRNGRNAPWHPSLIYLVIRHGANGPPAMDTGEPVVVWFLCRALRFAFVPVRINPLGFR